MALSTVLGTEIQQLLSRFAPLEDAVMEALLPEVRLDWAPKGTIFVHEGDFDQQVYLVLQGAVRAYHSIDDKEYTDWFALRGQFFSSISSYFQGLPSTHSYQALKKTHYVIIRKSTIDQLAERFRSMERLILGAVTESFLILQNRIVYHRFASAPDRYSALMQQTPELFQEVPLKYIASYLGISPETLSRIRAGQL